MGIAVYQGPFGRQQAERLLWRAGCLSRERLYLSADEVCADLASRPRADRG